MGLILLALSAGTFGTLALVAWRRGDREIPLAIAVTAVTPLAIRNAASAISAARQATLATPSGEQ